MGLFVCSKSHSCSWPAKLPVARRRSTSEDAPKLPHLNALGFSTSLTTRRSLPSSSYTCVKVCTSGGAELRVLARVGGEGSAALSCYVLRRLLVHAHLQAACVAGKGAESDELGAARDPPAGTGSVCTEHLSRWPPPCTDAPAVSTASPGSGYCSVLVLSTCQVLTWCRRP